MCYAVMENRPINSIISAVVSVTVVFAVLTVVCYASSQVSATKLGDETRCLPVSNVSVIRTAHKQGFHRNVVTNISIVTSLGPEYHMLYCEKCSIRLVEFLPEGLYVDTNQLKALQDFGSPQVEAFEEIDVEKPEFLSPNHTIHVYSRDVKLSFNHLTTSIDLPVHLRYHLPSEDPDVQYAFVHLPPPDVFVRCSACRKHFCTYVPPSEVHRVKQRCTLGSHPQCDWMQVLYDKDSETELEFQVPIGQANHSVLVVGVTLGAIIFGTAVLLWTMIKENNTSGSTMAKIKQR